jgi:molybdopterin-guanine dinucleotide biosynthesis protein A
MGSVLAGGRSSRMGRDKAMLPFRGQPLISHAVAHLRAAGCHAVIAGSRPDLEQFAPVLPDLHPGCGPLSGIEAALAAGASAGFLQCSTWNIREPALGASASSAPVLFVPVDLPLLPVSFLLLLLERAERTGARATVPLLGGRPQPLCAVYRTELLPGIRAALDSGEYKVMRALDALLPPRERDFFAVEAVLSARLDLLDQEPEPLHRWFSNLNTLVDLAHLDRTSQRGEPRHPLS